MALKRSLQVNKMIKHHDHKELANQLISVAKAMDVEIPYDFESFEFVHTLCRKASENAIDAKKFWELRRVLKITIK